MVEIYGVEFNNNSKIYFFDANHKKIKLNDYVIVETEKGTQIAKVVTELKKVEREKYKNLKKIIRIADSSDDKLNEENKKEADKALEKAEKIAKRLNLQMKFLNANITLDKTQLYLTFVADNRVDFRDLAKELARIYKMRIELRQIGIRDKAKEISGIGQCGRRLCCSSFLNNINSVSIGMVKNQNLSLNPNKINGQCGRLLCCLNYEDDMYTEAKKNLPTVGEMVKTEKGMAKVISVDILLNKYIAISENNEKIVVTKQNSSKSDENKIKTHHFRKKIIINNRSFK